MWNENRVFNSPWTVIFFHVISREIITSTVGYTLRHWNVILDPGARAFDTWPRRLTWDSQHGGRSRESTNSTKYNCFDEFFLQETNLKTFRLLLSLFSELYVQFSESISCCWEQKQVCDECFKKNGQVSYSPALRACSHWLNNNVQCANLAILALSSDCETGNRKAMELLEQRQKAGLADPQIFVYLPDAVHVGKSCKSVQF